MIELTHQVIDEARLLAGVKTAQAGAVVLFLGTVRELTAGRKTLSLDYECYSAMAEKKLAALESAARARWPIIECALIHRLGHLALGETSVAVAVSCPHRDQAFEAGRWLIDAIKIEVPIWKQEHWADGTQEWVHPPTPPGDHDADSAPARKAAR